MNAVLIDFFSPNYIVIEQHHFLVRFPKNAPKQTSNGAWTNYDYRICLLFHDL